MLQLLPAEDFFFQQKCFKSNLESNFEIRNHCVFLFLMYKKINILSPELIQP